MKAGAEASSVGRDARRALERLLAEAGSCRSCRHAEVKIGARSAFLLCGLSEYDRRFAKYPRLPVLECPGFEGTEAARETGEAGC